MELCFGENLIWIFIKYSCIKLSIICLVYPIWLFTVISKSELGAVWNANFNVFILLSKKWLKMSPFTYWRQILTRWIKDANKNDDRQADWMNQANVVVKYRRNWRIFKFNLKNRIFMYEKISFLYFRFTFT